MTPTYQAIVLAAGAGTRFGGGKLTATWQGRPMVLAVLEIALALPVDEVLVVTGFDAQGVTECLAPLARARWRAVYTSDWAQGLSASLKTGIGALPANSGGALLFLGDMPAVPSTLARRVFDTLRSGAVAVQPQYRAQPAHPVGLSRIYYPRLMDLTGDVGVGKLLANDKNVIQLVTPHPGAAYDIDDRGPRGASHV